RRCGTRPDRCGTAGAGGGPGSTGGGAGGRPPPGRRRSGRQAWWTGSCRPPAPSLPTPARIRPPTQQRRLGLVPVQRPAVQADVLEVRPGTADVRAGLEVEQPHDLVAVEVRPDAGEVLLLLDLRDPVLQRIVGGLQPGGAPL